MSAGELVHPLGAEADPPSEAQENPPAGWVVLRAVVPQQIAAALPRTDRLSGRERAVFELLGLGHDNRSLARELKVSERTAKRHVTAILAKLGLESRLQAGLAAMLTLSSGDRSHQADAGLAGGPKVA